jgi:hypothetical protein
MNAIQLVGSDEASAKQKADAAAKQREVGCDVVKRLAPELLELVGMPDLAARLRLYGDEQEIDFDRAADVVEAAFLRIRDNAEECHRDMPEAARSEISCALFELSQEIMCGRIPDAHFRVWPRAAEHALRCANEMTRHAQSVQRLAKRAIEGWGPLLSAKPAEHSA